MAICSLCCIREKANTAREASKISNQKSLSFKTWELLMVSIIGSSASSLFKLINNGFVLLIYWYIS